MNILLIFFALPIATIIISIALQKILRCPPLVAGIIFAIFLIVTFIINNLNFLIATIVYTIISFLTAIVVCLICKILQKIENSENCRCRNCNQDNLCSQMSNDIITIDSTYQNNGANGILTLNALSNNNCNRSNSNNNNGCGCSNNNNNNCCCNNNDGCNSNNLLNARINVIPNSNMNGRTGCLCGNYRRR